MRSKLGYLVAPLAAVLLGSLGSAPALAERRPPLVGSLELGESVFWKGAYVEGTTHIPYVMQDPCAADQCWTYRLKLAERGDSLKVGIDVPMRDDRFTLEVQGPDGRRAGRASNDNQYNAEVVVHDPRPGTWRVLVSTTDATDTAFRLRAKLDRARRKPKPRALMLPNLQVIPPFEFGFVAPANPLNGQWPPDDVNPGLEVAGVAPVSCAADEIAEDGAVRCLRFSAGPTNAGRGPFDLVLEPGGSVKQRVHRGDGSSYLRPAGEHEYHRTHGHTHYKDVLTYKLFEVTDRKRGKMKQVGRGVKSGFCPADQAFAQWRVFRQAPAYSTGGNCSTSMGLSTGWGDVYRWQRPGQYVEFSGATDGLFVVRATADINRWVLESNERDNHGYALIRVKGDEVKILERARGKHPWDPMRRPARDSRPLD